MQRAIKQARCHLADASSAPEGSKVLTKIVNSGGDDHGPSAMGADNGTTMKDDQLASELTA